MICNYCYREMVSRHIRNRNIVLFECECGYSVVSGTMQNLEYFGLNTIAKRERDIVLNLVLSRPPEKEDE